MFWCCLFLIIKPYNALYSQSSQFNQFANQSLFDGAVKDYANGYYSRALSRANTLIQIDSLNTNALLLKSRVIQVYLNDTINALKLLDKALTYEPNNIILIKSKAQLLIERKELRNALDVLGMIDFKDWDMEMSIIMANILFLSDQPELIRESQNFLRSLVQNNPNPKIFEQIALTFSKNNLDSAIYYVKKCISLDSTNQNYYFNLAGLYYIHDRDEEAISLITHGLINCNEKDRLYYLLSQINLYGKKDIQSSFSYLDQAIQMNPTEEYIYQRARLNDSIGQKQLAYNDYRYLLNQKPWNIKYLKIVVNYEIISQYYNQAAGTIQNSVKYDTTLADSCADMLMNVYFLNGKFDSAYLYIDKEIVKKKTEFNDKLIRAMLLGSEKRYDESMSICNELTSGKQSLSEDQDFNVMVLKSLLSLLKKQYDAFYTLCDKLFQNNKDKFLKSINFNVIETDQETKRELVITPKDSGEFNISVNITKSEFKAIQKKYNL